MKGENEREWEERMKEENERSEWEERVRGEGEMRD